MTPPEMRPQVQPAEALSIEDVDHAVQKMVTDVLRTPPAQIGVERYLSNTGLRPLLDSEPRTIEVPIFPRSRLILDR